ncbi:hypothetical protein JOE44_001960 [Chryseobacterium sp. PvR013]|uniref:hypothetical protein n=1 Tax=Chryseobacterium sp. PvR013 TaxID=2806595 RepID=UPI001AE7EE75|nr:hypothetical protein [Chryseobacterium sp. PvR013]MBP1165076.1 hypothetical protein [Chryseobacterium sp. PvR013]
MKINDNYAISENSISFEKGCTIDYEILWTILVDNLLKQENVETIFSKSMSGSDAVKFNKKVIVEIKTIERKPKP